MYIHTILKVLLYNTVKKFQDIIYIIKSYKAESN